MAHVCCIVPDYILSGIVEQGNASDKTLDACRFTITQTSHVRNARKECGARLAASRRQAAHHSHGGGIQGIVPPQIHSAIAESSTGDQRDASLRTLEHDTELRAARQSKPKPQQPVKGLVRKVYDAQHATAEDNVPRDKLLIDEGGAAVPLSEDPTNDANECYSGFQKTYDFYLKYFKRNSIDDKGMELDGFVHFGTDYQNAFWDGQQMIFGDGDGEIFNGFTDELDVIAHELTHGVTEHTSPLTYSFQSGALNESLSDVFGIMVKQYGQDPANPQTADKSDWLIGEGIFTKAVKGVALRSMKAPGTAYNDPKVGKDQQPAHWKNFKTLPISSDQGGVHINSGIPNHAFYLAATKIGGFAWEGAGQVWYKAMTSGELKPEATFKEFADLTIKNAGDYKQQVTAAWTEVGYPFPAKAGEL